MRCAASPSRCACATAHSAAAHCRHRRVSALCSPAAQNLRPWPTFAATAPAPSRTPPSHQIGDHVREDNKMLDGLDDRCAEERQIERRGTLRPPAGRPYLGGAGGRTGRPSPYLAAAKAKHTQTTALGHRRGVWVDARPMAVATLERLTGLARPQVGRRLPALPVPPVPVCLPTCSCLPPHLPPTYSYLPPHLPPHLYLPAPRTGDQRGAITQTPPQPPPASPPVPAPAPVCPPASRTRARPQLAAHLPAHPPLLSLPAASTRPARCSAGPWRGGAP